MKRKSLRIVLLGFCAFALLTVMSPQITTAAPATFTVTNTNDSGAGSLRQAILDANANGNPADMDVIEFDIPGSDVHTISIQSDLPLASEKVTIDGYSQTGAQANTAVAPEPINSVIKIEIDGTNATIADGALNLQANESVIKGLSVYGASRINGGLEDFNVHLSGNDTKVLGCYIGLKADGMTAGEIDKNSVGIVSDGTNTSIGGINPGDRNILFNKSSIPQSASVAAKDGTTTIYGNYFGLAKDGTTDLSPEQANLNAYQGQFWIGVNIIDNSTATIGGSTSNKRNVISGNSTAIAINSTNFNIIQGNYIGTDYTGQVKPSISNGLGIVASVGANSIIGGVNAGEGNIIAGVKGSGVEIASMFLQALNFTVTPNKISILGNSIYDISPFDMLGIGDTNLGIDISRFFDTDGNFLPDQFQDRGPNSNDAGDVDTGANGEINYPVIKSAVQVGDQLTIKYDLDAADSPSNSYRVEFFANNNRTLFGNGPGETYVGFDTVSPGNDKTTVLTINGDFTHKSLSATTTAVDSSTSSGFGSTSEFSSNVSIGSISDFDADSISDTEEDAGPNNGDANADGTADRLQPTVTTFVNSANIYITLATEGCSENGTVSSIDLASLDRKDNGYAYPFGLTDFKLNCSRGDTVDVEIFIHTAIEPDNYLPRKFNSVTREFSDILGSTLAQVTVGDSSALKLSYSSTDGGRHDDDGEANGIIVDPVGLATEQPKTSTPGQLANTGITTVITTFLAGSILALVVYTYVDYRKHKKPLLAADIEAGAQDAKKYTYWHHLNVVSLPLAQYRLRVVIEEKRRKTVEEIV